MTTFMASVRLNPPSPAHRALRDHRITRPLRLFAVAAGLSVCAGTVLICYGRTIGAYREPVEWLHEYSGDLAGAFLLWYLWLHVRRTWPMRRARPVSWWTGITGLTGWAVALVTGVYGQFLPLEGIWWWTHAAASLVSVVAVLFHSALGYRALRAQEVMT